MKGYYTISKVTYTGETRIASFQSVDNVRAYIEANCPNLDEIRALTIHGKPAPTGPLPHLYHHYIPVAADNADGYLIKTKEHDPLRVRYIKFDD